MSLPLAAALVALSLAPAPAAAATASRSRFVLGTVCEITAHGPDAGGAIEAAFKELARLERVMSFYDEDSELSRLNRQAQLNPALVSNDLFETLHAANEAYRLSGGAFDPTFVEDRPAPGFKLVVLDANQRTVEFKDPAVRVNVAGVGKGYALDAAAATLLSHGATAALLDFSGQILAVGVPPGQDAWGVQVGSTTLVLALKNKSISIASNAERPGHIRDPRTGKAVERKSAVVVVANDAAHAKAWSTALYVLGVAKAPKAFTGCAFETYRGAVTVKTRGCAPYFPDGKTGKAVSGPKAGPAAAPVDPQ